MPNTDLTTTDAAELEAIEAQESALAEASKAGLAGFGATVPRIDVVQGTTKQPPPDANLGDFYNTLTGAVLGTNIEFLVAEVHKGRFLSDKRSPDGRTYSAGADIVVPNHWPEQYRGRVFAELPEAQETYSRLVNEGDIEWGSGPAIQDSFNFTGFVTQASGEDVEPFPVRLSLKSTSAKAARKAGALLRGQPTLWSKAIAFHTERKVGDAGPYFVVVTDGYGAEPTVPQRKAAVEAALFAQQVGFIDPETVGREKPGVGGTGDEPTGDPVVPSAKGAEF